MKKYLKRMIALTLVMTLGIAGSVTDVQAASKATKAKAAYKKILAKRPHQAMTFEESWNVHNKDNNDKYDTFYLKDIDGDKVPELFTITFVWARHEVVRVFTYKNGRVKLVKKFDNNHGANGSYNTYICKKNHIHNIWGGMGVEEKVYKMKNGKIYRIKKGNCNLKTSIYEKSKCNTSANRKKVLR